MSKRKPPLYRAIMFGLGVFVGAFIFAFFNGGAIDWNRVFLLPVVAAVVYYLFAMATRKKEPAGETTEKVE